jgi:hypothetical protein
MFVSARKPAIRLPVDADHLLDNREDLLGAVPNPAHNGSIFPGHLVL